MALGTTDVVFNPYDYDFHEDPYPYYRRLRDEAPLYRNDELKFWALSRHTDVLAGLPQQHRRCRTCTASRSTRSHVTPKRTR